MPLRCLLFSSDETLVQPIWQILADLGIEGEYCPSAVDAVERVTTQLFQIVITDWDDQPEAAFLLKTARDLKAAHRPLALAIVSDDARLPEALQAGANSVLSKPIRPEQVRDTMSTACELLRAKLPSVPPQPPVTAALPQIKEPVAMAAAAAGAVSTPRSAVESHAKTFRAGEFLQSPSSAPGAQFDTETECDVQKSLDKAAMAEMDALTELEPMASSVVKNPQATSVEPQEALTGWSSLQARLTKSAPPAPVEASPKNELLAYGETPSHGAQAAPPQEDKDHVAKSSEAKAGPEAALFAYIEGEPKEHAVLAERVQPWRGELLLMGALGFGCVVLVAVPKTRLSLRTFYRSALHAGGNWLNPQPVPVPTVTQHENFGQAGDEYKLPATANIPDATTDPSQIRVVPVIDPTAKPTKNSDASGGQASATDDGTADQKQNEPGDSGQAQVADNDVKEQPTANAGNVAGSPAAASPVGIVPPAPAQPNPPSPQVIAPQQPVRPITPPIQSFAPPAVSTGNSAAIPSSLRSQTASMTPDASGAKPVEAAMSSIEPVNLPESAAWSLLAQPVDPVYPDAAKAGGQRGSVVLQVLIGRDGTVQDAKFLQGSLVFARAAIDAVKQWRFKPYSLNGRAVSVQTSITLNFKPPS
ncbi:MAG: TonB family protein [Candidatus Sulfotelmatobacter sp.]